VALGAEVLGPFADVQHALSFLGSGTAVDVALLDVNVRSQMVFPLARKLQSHGVPIVFTTGYGKTSLAAEFQAVELWHKPLDLAALPSLADLLR
jgi:DNA-binding LytR/AlgR family response regulator